MIGFTLLIVEDDEDILEANALYLQKKGYTVLKAGTLKGARVQMTRKPLDLILLDIEMPDGSGLAFCHEIRAYSVVPILFLSCHKEEQEVVEGLIAGGDDYMTKPYHMTEMAARCASILRRTHRYAHNAAQENSVTCGPLVLDLVSSKAFLNGKDMLLTQKEFALLLLLAQNEGNPLTKEYLYETVWKQPMSGDGNALWKQISRLKKKLDASDFFYFSMSRGKGYSLSIKARPQC